MSPNAVVRSIGSMLADWTGVAVSELDEGDNLIELGLDSLRMMHVASAIGRAGARVHFAELARSPTFGAWKQLIAARMSDTESATTAHRAQDLGAEDEFDLALMQHAYWVGRGEEHVLGGVAAHFYNEFDGVGVDPPRLERSLRSLFARHAQLRIAVSELGRQRVLPTTVWRGLQVHDLRTDEESAVAEALEELRRRLSHRQLRIAEGEVFDVQLSLLPGGRTRLHVNLDMVAADALSLRILLADLAELYRADGRADALPPIHYSYAAYLGARRSSREHADRRERDAVWWGSRLASLPSAPSLPVRASKQGVTPTRVVRRHAWLDGAGKQRLFEHAQRRGITPAMALCTAFCETVGRFSTDEAFLINVPLFDRAPIHEHVDQLVGDFTGSVLLAARGRTGEPFAARARALQARFHEDAAHAEYAGVEVLRDLARRAGGERVLAPVVFTSALSLGELFAPAVRETFGQPAWIISQGPQVWLDAQVTELNGGLLLNWDALEDAFHEGVLDAMFDAFSKLVAQLGEDAASWDAPARHVLPASQRRARAEANATDAPRSGALLHEPFLRHARAHPERVAVVVGDAQLTYGALHERALHVAGALAQRGAKPGERVGICLPKGADQAVAVLATLLTGAAYVPIDVEQPVARKQRIAAHAALVVALVAEDEVGTFPRLKVCTIEAARSSAPLRTPACLDDAAAAYVLFTSGSTGEPKGVVMSHRGAANTIEDLVERFAMTASDRTLGLSSLAFDLSVFDLFAAWWVGGAVVIVRPEERRDAGAWLQRMRQHRVSVLNCVPSALRMMLDAPAHVRDSGLAQLRLVMLGGDWIGVDLPTKLARVSPSCRFFGLGGTTETAIHSTHFEVRAIGADWQSVPYGKPLRNVRCRIVDGREEDRPDWVPGELWIGGLGLADGYLGDAQRTGERFVERQGQRWYRTGDSARYWPDGTIEFLGRTDHQVKVRGHRIELGEIEAVLRAAPGIGQAVATIVDAPAGGKRVAAAVTLVVADESGDGQPRTEGPVEGPCAVDPLEEAVVASALERVLARVGPDVAEGMREVSAAWRRWLAVRGPTVPLDALAAEVAGSRLERIHARLTEQVDELADVLRGSREPLALLDDPVLAPEAAILSLPGADDALRRLAKCIDAHPRRSDGPIRIALLGARSGLALAGLAQWVARPDVHYALLDGSPTQLGRARAGLAGLVENWEAHVLANDLVPDGLLGVFDVVIAVGTLHAYADLCTGIAQAAHLLGPRGLLLAIEQETLSPLGLISAMVPTRAFAALDDVRRSAQTPLVSTERWLTLLAAVGFASTSVEHQASEPRWLLRGEASDVSCAMRRAQLQKRASSQLPAYMIPSRILFVPSLPLSANGKIDRGTVRKWLEQVDQPAARPAYEAPSTPAEHAVAGAWSELLSVEAVGRHDQFFALGGDSLLGTRMLQRLRERGFQGQIAPLFTHPMLMDYARTLEASRGAQRVVIVPRPEEAHQPFAPTDVQRAYCIGRMQGIMLGGVGAHYYSEFDGEGVDLGRLTDALRILIERHPALRTVFDEGGDQRVLSSVAPYIIHTREVGADASEEALLVLRDQMSHQVFDPTRWPLFDVRAIVYERDGGERTRVGIGLDNLLLDGLSMMTLYTELSALYADPHRRLAPISLTFRDYLTQVLPDASKVEAARAYWRARVDAMPPAPTLPLAVDPATLTTLRFVRHPGEVSAAIWTALKRRAREHGVTPSALLLTIYADVLGAFSERADLTINLTLFDRQEVHPEIHRVLGDFTSLLPAVYLPKVGESWVGRVRRTQGQLWQDLDHRAVSGVWIMRELARRSGESHAQLPVVFTSALGVDGDVSLEPGHGFPAQIWGISQTPQAWLDLQVYERRDGALALHWDHVEALFQPGFIAQMADAFLGLAHTLAAKSWEEARPALLPTAQRYLRARNHADRSVHAPRTLHEPFFAWARRQPDAPAVMCDEQVFTREEIAQRALRIAARLRSLGIGSGALVAVCLAKGAAQVAAVFGVLAAGAAYVPIGMDQPPIRRERMLASAHVACVVDEAFVALSQDGAVERPVPVAPDARAYVIFTSGSTGEPKGVAISHWAAVNTLEAMRTRFGVSERDRVLGVSALDFDLSVFDIFGVLAAGGVLVLPRDEERRDAQRLRDLTVSAEITIWNSVPMLLEMMLTVCTNVSLPALRLSLVSGDWVPLTLPAQHAAVTNAEARLIALGGATEASIWSNYFDATKGAPAGWPSIPYGVPLANQRFRVVNEQGEDCPDWVPGELWIGGDGLAEEYVGDPSRTAERFVIADCERWYRTGDRGRYRPGGLLEFLGRRDGQLKIRGHRTELGEIEAALMAQPGILHAVVIPTGGSGRMRLTAYAVCSEPAGQSADEVRRALRARLSEHAIPEVVQFVTELPLTANGKVDRTALAARADNESGSAAEKPEAARTELEQRVAAVWSELLGGDPIGCDDHFFKKGGDSLLATRLVSRLEGAGLSARISELFAHPVLADFVATLDETATRHAPARPSMPGSGRAHEPFACTEVQRAYLVGRSEELPLGGVASHYYQEQDEDDCDTGALEAAVLGLVERHPMLRAVFDREGRQRVLEVVPAWTLDVVDLRGQGMEETERALMSMRATMSHRVADPQRWPLFEVRAARYCAAGQERTRVAVSLDNLIVDGLSMLIFFSELATLRAGRPLDPPPSISFREYLATSTTSLRERDRSERYWTEKLEQLSRAPALPTACDPSAIAPVRFTRRLAHLPREDWTRLLQRTRAEGITPSVLLLWVYAEALAAHSARSALSIQLTLLDRGRVHEDIDRVVGDFTSLLLWSHRPEPGETIRQRLVRTQEQLGRDLEHRAVSSMWVMRQLFARDRDAGTIPVVFTSALGLDDARARALSVPTWSVSQTPQVWLDHQVMEDERGLRMTWDAVDGLFPAGLVDAVAQRQEEIIGQLLVGSWDRLAPWPVAEPARGALPSAASLVRAPVRDERIEGWLGQLWRELLTPTVPVTADSGFFALGGDSLLATRMIERARAHYGVEVRLRDFLTDPTLASLVGLVQGACMSGEQKWEEGEL